MVSVLMAISGYYISDILLMVIGGYSINGYRWLFY
jgi:hypothetical protein